MTLRRLPREAVAAAGLLALDALARLLAGDPYPGATFLLLARVRRLAPPAAAERARLAVLAARRPAGARARLVRASADDGVGRRHPPHRALDQARGARLRPLRSLRQPADASRRATSLVGEEGRRRASRLSPESSASHSLRRWDVIEPFPPRGTDWGHYLLYGRRGRGAGQARCWRSAMPSANLARFADTAGVGAVYGSLRDPGRSLVGVARARPRRCRGADSSRRVRSRRCALGNRVPGFWLRPRMPSHRSRLEPLYWHGLATTLALALPAARGARARSPVPGPARLAGRRAARILSGVPRGDALGERGDRRHPPGAGSPRRCPRRAPPPAWRASLVAQGMAKPVLVGSRRRMRARDGRDRAPPSVRRRPGCAGELSLLRAGLARRDHTRVLLLLALPRARGRECRAGRMEPRCPARPRPRGGGRTRALVGRRQPALAGRGRVRVSARRLLLRASRS